MNLTTIVESRKSKESTDYSAGWLIPLLDPRIKVVSFDVFDTVLTRITAEPVGVFMRIQKYIQDRGELIQSDLDCNFARIRIEAERSARKKTSREDVTIHEIYHELGTRHHVTEDQIALLIDLEIKEELRSVRPVASVIRLIDEIRKACKRIIFISDMYLPEQIIKSMLADNGALRPDDSLYVSSKSDRTKSSGSLYRYVLMTEGILASEIIHIGDNLRSDVLSAKKKAGIHSIHFQDCMLNAYEQTLLSADSVSATTLQQVAGASRAARLSPEFMELNKPDFRAFYKLGSNVAGPILTGFILWVLAEASARNIRRLYFMARDGQVLFEIAQRLVNKAKLDFDLRYLYGSRQAWYLPSLTSANCLNENWIYERNPIVTLRIMALRLEVPIEILCSVLQKFIHCDPDRKLTNDEIDTIRELLCRNESLYEPVLNKAAKRRESAIGYFRQEGLTNNDSWALVDLGWAGSLQDSLYKILKTSRWEGQMTGFYFGLEKTGSSVNRKLSYFFNKESKNEFYRWGMASVSLLEVLCSANHGMTLRYKMKKNGIYYPVLKDHMADVTGGTRLSLLRRGIMSFVDEIDPENTSESIVAYRKGALAVLKQLYLSPSLQEAEAIGSFCFTGEQIENVLPELAPPLKFRHALLYLLYFTRPERLGITRWIHGSKVRSGRLVRILLSTATRFLYLSINLREKVNGVFGQKSRN